MRSDRHTPDETCFKPTTPWLLPEFFASGVLDATTVGLRPLFVASITPAPIIANGQKATYLSSDRRL
jgi:hypothetical protein